MNAKTKLMLPASALSMFLASPSMLFGQANYATPYTFSTLAGLAGNPGSADGTGSAARFHLPFGVTVDSNGNVYVADTFNDTIRKVTPAGDGTTLAGLPGSIGSADGTGRAARFNTPFCLSADSLGTIYVVDSDNHTVRKVTPAGVVTTLAGQPGSSGSADGTGSTARFNFPEGVAVASSGDIYVADTYNDTLRKVTPAGVVTTLAGLAGNSGSADGTGSAARFNLPQGIGVDSDGTVYVADTGNFTIRKVTPAGVVTTLAGLAGTSGSADGTGSAARFYYPYSVVVDSAGNVYVADFTNFTIRKVTPAGVVTTLAGLAGSSGSADGRGSAARFYYPGCVTLDAAGNLYVADTINNTIRKGASIPFVQVTVSPTNGTVPLTAQFTSDGIDSSGHTITNWAWAFGDGSTSTLQNPSHTYVGEGYFYPSLIASNDVGGTVLSSVPYVNVMSLVMNGGFETGDFFAWTLNGQGSPYNLVDTFYQSTEGMEPHATSSWFARLGQINTLGYLSQNLATTPGASYILSFWLNSPDGGTPNQFQVSWDGTIIYSAMDLPPFGNDPATAWSNFTFVVSATTSSTVLQFGFRDEPTALGLDDVGVVQAVVAGFSASPTSGIAPLTVTFTNLSTGATNYAWSFGDGNTSASLNPINTYTNTGSYSVTLTAVGPGSTNSFTRTGYILVTNPPVGPIALSLVRQGTNVILSWPQTPDSNVLEQCDNLSPANWGPAGGVVQPVGEEYQVTLPLTNSSQYFRLRKQ